MNLTPYKALIAKVLEQSSGQKLSAIEVAGRIIERVEEVEGVVAAMGGAAIPVLPAAQAAPAQSIQAGRPVQVFPTTDLSTRIGASQEIGEPAENFTKDELSAFAKSSAMPEYIEVQPPGFDKPFPIKKFIQAAPGDMGFVRIIYQQEASQPQSENGQRIGPTVQISTTDKSLDPYSLVTEIVKQASGMFSVKPRTVAPQFTFVPRDNVLDFSDAISDTTDNTGSGFEEWQKGSKYQQVGSATEAAIKNLEKTGRL